MRPASGLSADGNLNLLNAIRVAAHPDSGGRGVLVVLNDTIHGARDVTKTATFHVQTFQGRDLKGAHELPWIGFAAVVVAPVVQVKLRGNGACLALHGRLQLREVE